MKYLKIKIPLGIKIVFLSIVFINNSYTQTDDDDSSDFATWSSIVIEYKLNKKWIFSLGEQLRLKNNSSEIDEYFSQFETGYKILKNVKLGVGARFIRFNDNRGNLQGYENHFRFHLNATYNHKLNDFSFEYRLRYQNKNEMGITVSEGDYAKQNIRFKTGIQYNIKKWPLDPKFSAEVYNRFEEDDENRFSKYRLTLGTVYKIKNFGRIKVFYRIEKELNVDEPETTNILGFNYTYTFKNK